MHHDRCGYCVTTYVPDNQHHGYCSDYCATSGVNLVVRGVNDILHRHETAGGTSSDTADRIRQEMEDEKHAITGAVARVITPSTRATGFLIGLDLVMTNYRVIPSRDIALRSEF